ncbi:hypothetical protein BZG36_03572 [Bifiguratus adelaidae]|uniref:Sulfotransferase domain-containing protein n=1 Tax=Bifiguratus adelaidae TaxID=1938954 RepID=A0A261Y0A3_9FUNG|nr:hypothetical protein BZG36_03572 [Bifiguratus adelaidae]
MTLRVYCTGFGRTGTNSLKEALEILGYPCFHMVEIIDKKAVDPTLFIDALHGKPIDWGFHLQRVYSCLRLAGFYFYKEIIDHYPDAKIIYTDRDPDKFWFTPSQVRKTRAMTDELWAAVFSNGFLDKEASKKVML